MSKKYYKKNTGKQIGFVLLFASLIGGLVLAIGVAILDVTVKQITLASAGRESQKAFYAADTGIECAQYLLNGGGNPLCTAGVILFPNSDGDLCQPNSYIYKCLGLTVTGLSTGTYTTGTQVGGVTQIASFNINDGNTCFDVKIEKKFVNDDPTKPATKITSYGYSTCTIGALNRFERVIEMNQ